MLIECRHCQRANREDALFCDACGRRMAAGGELAERAAVELRYGTFVFCDMVHSTALANRIDLEDLRRVFRWFRQQVDLVAKQHDGHLIRFVGDGAFLSFGLPRASEDAAESAVRAGLGLVNAMRAGEPIPGLKLSVRVGIASGTVVFGDMIDEPLIKEESVIGTVPHLAARLADQAPPDGVVIADITKRAVGQFFDCQNLGQLALKGFDGGERAWRVVSESQIVSKFEAHNGAEAAGGLVNCVDAMAALRAAWAASVAGQGRAVILSGDAGIGKSKVAHTLRAEAVQAGASLMQIDCAPRTRNTPLYPVSVLMRQLAGIGPNDTDDERMARAAELLARVPGAAGSIESALRDLAPCFGLEADGDDASGDSAERVRERTIGLLVDLLASMMGGGPLFMLCEDMHWADASSLLVVQRLCERMATLPALLIATCRPGSDGAQVELPNSTRIALGALDHGCAAEMVQRLTPADALPAETIERIIERADGVPLFLEELCRSELDEASQSARPRARARRSTSVPHVLQAIIEARLDRWSGIKSIIQAASVIGRDFTLPLLAELLHEGRTDLPEAVARLVDAGLLTQDIEGRTGKMRFRHALIHDAVYETLLVEERQRLHARVAHLLVQHFDGLPESAPDVIAQHLVAARQFEEAVTSLIAAEAQASSRAAYLESASHSRNALALLPEIADTRKRTQFELQLLIQLGVAVSATQGYTAPEVEATYQRAREVARDDPDPAQAFAAVRGLATFYFVRDEQRMADEMSALGLEMAHNSARIDFVIEALTVRGYTDMYMGRLESAQEALQQCAALYRQHQGERFRYPSVQDAGTAAWSILGMVCWLRGDSQGADASLALAIEHAGRLARPFDQAYANCFIAQQLNVQRRHAEALRHATVCVDLAQRHGFNTWLVCGLMQQAIAAAAMGPAPDAVAGLRMAMGAYLGAGARAAMPFFSWGLAHGLRQLGDLDGARQALTDGLKHAQESGEIYLSPELMILAAELETSQAHAWLLYKEARRLALQQGGTLLALRATLSGLRRLGLGSDDPARDFAAWEAIEGRTPAPLEADWARSALLGASPAFDGAEARVGIAH